MSKFFLPILFLAIATSATPVSSDVFPLPDKAHIIANGQGTVEQIPDVITLRFNVSNTAESFSIAKKTVDNIVAKAISVARKHAVHKEHITASKLNAYPQYEWKQSVRHYVGEQVDRQVEIKLTNAKHYNDLVNGLLEAGITRLQPAQMSFSEREALESEALIKALDDARNKATSMAKHLGTTVGEVYQIAPQGLGQTIERMAMRANDSHSAKAAPLTLGKQTIKQRIRVVFLLEN